VHITYKLKARQAKKNIYIKKISKVNPLTNSTKPLYHRISQKLFITLKPTVVRAVKSSSLKPPFPSYRNEMMI